MEGGKGSLECSSFDLSFQKTQIHVTLICTQSEVLEIEEIDQIIRDHIALFVWFFRFLFWLFFLYFVCFLIFDF